MDKYNVSVQGYAYDDMISIEGDYQEGRAGGIHNVIREIPGSSGCVLGHGEYFGTLDNRMIQERHDAMLKRPCKTRADWHHFCYPDLSANITIPMIDAIWKDNYSVDMQDGNTITMKIRGKLLYITKACFDGKHTLNMRDDSFDEILASCEIKSEDIFCLGGGDILCAEMIKAVLDGKDISKEMEKCQRRTTKRLREKQRSFCR